MNCLICEAKTDGFIDEQFNVQFQACSECQVIFRAEAHLLSPKLEKARYDLHTNTLEDRSYVAYLSGFLKRAAIPIAIKGARGLDYGCGPAPVLSRILERDYGYKMDVYDPFYSPEPVFAGKKYDLITCTEVAEHVKKPLELFKILSEHLAFDGVLALMTTFHRNDREHFLNWFYSRDPTHIVFYTSNTMQKLADRSGLRIIHCDNVNSITFAPA